MMAHWSEALLNLDVRPCDEGPAPAPDCTRKAILAHFSRLTESWGSAFLLGLAPIPFFCAIAFGQGAPQRVGARELAAHPERYLGKPIELSAAYCSSDDKGVFDCSTDGAVHIAPTA